MLLLPAHTILPQGDRGDLTIGFFSLRITPGLSKRDVEVLGSLDLSLLSRVRRDGRLMPRGCVLPQTIAVGSETRWPSHPPRTANSEASQSLQEPLEHAILPPIRLRPLRPRPVGGPHARSCCVSCPSAPHTPPERVWQSPCFRSPDKSREVARCSRQYVRMGPGWVPDGGSREAHGPDPPVLVRASWPPQQLRGVSRARSRGYRSRSRAGGPRGCRRAP